MPVIRTYIRSNNGVRIKINNCVKRFKAELKDNGLVWHWDHNSPYGYNCQLWTYLMMKYFKKYASKYCASIKDKISKVTGILIVPTDDNGHWSPVVHTTSGESYIVDAIIPYLGYSEPVYPKGIEGREKWDKNRENMGYGGQLYRVFDVHHDLYKQDLKSYASDNKYKPIIDYLNSKCFGGK